MSLTIEQALEQIADIDANSPSAIDELNNILGQRLRELRFLGCVPCRMLRTPFNRP